MELIVEAFIRIGLLKHLKHLKLSRVSISVHVQFHVEIASFKFRYCKMQDNYSIYITYILLLVLTEALTTQASLIAVSCGTMNKT